MSVALGREHMLMLDDQGDLFAVGEGADGQLGTVRERFFLFCFCFNLFIVFRAITMLRPSQ